MLAFHFTSIEALFQTKLDMQSLAPIELPAISRIKEEKSSNPSPASNIYLGLKHQFYQEKYRL